MALKPKRWANSLIAALRTRRARRIALIVLGGIVGLFLIAQLVYPRDRALPGTMLGEHDISGWTKDDIAKLTKELYQVSTVEVAGSDKTMLARSLSTVGVGIDVDQVVEQATDYGFWWRLLPTSMLWLGDSVGTLEGQVDADKLDKFVKESESSFVISPENARLVVEGPEVKIQDAVDGATLSAEQFKQGIKSAKYALGSPTLLDVTFAYTEPQIKKADLEELRSRVQDMISRDLSLVFEDTKEAVDKPTLATWLVFNQDEAEAAADVMVDINQDAILQFVHAKFDSKVVKKAGVTELYLTDGIEQSRKAGPDGRAINEAATVAALKSAIIDGQGGEVAVSAVTVPASVKKHHTFTKSQAGLQAYLNSLADEGDIRVSVTQLGAAGWSASYRGSEQTVAASTYKVYVVAYVLDQIAEGELSYDDEINGTTYRECMSRTIIKSDNACPEAILAKFGRSTVNDFVYAKGFSRATNLNHSTASQSSTNDLVKAMIAIERSELVSGAERSFMIDLMKRQVYRQGIPAGTSASSAGKVGFLWGYLNDAAIVYHPGGTYVISVMTNNASWSKIAEITRKVEEIMY